VGSGVGSGVGIGVGTGLGANILSVKTFKLGSSSGSARGTVGELQLY